MAKTPGQGWWGYSIPSGARRGYGPMAGLGRPDRGGHRGLDRCSSSRRRAGAGQLRRAHRGRDKRRVGSLGKGEGMRSC